ncbi:MAG: hypothetical protein V1822_04010 [Candidatus Micrarchaeota archaeon]
MFCVKIAKKPAKFLRELDEKRRFKINEVFEALEKNPWPARDYDLAKIAGMGDC